MTTRKKDGDTLVDTGGGHNFGDHATIHGDIVGGNKSDRSVTINGPTTGSTIITGDGNSATNNMDTSEAESSPKTIQEFRQQLQEIEQTLAGITLETHDAKLAQGTLSHAQAEVNKEQPKKNKIAQSLRSIADIVEAAEPLTEAAQKTAQKLKNLAAWVGISSLFS